MILIFTNLFSELKTLLFNKIDLYFRFSVSFLSISIPFVKLVFWMSEKGPYSSIKDIPFSVWYFYSWISLPFFNVSSTVFFSIIFSLSSFKCSLCILKYWPTSLSNNFWESNLLSTCTAKFGQDADILWRYFSTSILFLIVSKDNILLPRSHGFCFSTLKCLILLEFSGCISSFWNRWWERFF